MLMVVLIVAVILLAVLLWEVAVMAENVRGLYGVLLAINEKLDRIVPAESVDSDDELDDEDAV